MEDEWADESWLTAEVRELFDDPRYKHLSSLSMPDTMKQEDPYTDPAMFLTAVSNLYGLISVEKQAKTAQIYSQALVRATWVLAAATIGLVLATIVLVVVTVA